MQLPTSGRLLPSVTKNQQPTRPYGKSTGNRFLILPLLLIPKRSVEAIAERGKGDRVWVKWYADNSIRIEEIENVQSMFHIFQKSFTGGEIGRASCRERV